MNIKDQVSFYFLVGDCTGCPFYEVHMTCLSGKCEEVRGCHLLDHNMEDMTVCKQYQEDQCEDE